MKKVIAIDGPSGSGKSTIAKEVAKILGFQYLDTGALYRAVALYFFRKFGNSNIALQNIKKELINIKIEYENGRVYLAGEDVSDLIRDLEVGNVTSRVSTVKAVRDFLLPLQRGFAQKYNLVAEGRDMTTVVFPDAWKKFYLDAAAKIRAQRRFEQLRSLGRKVSFEEVLKEITCRDRIDSTRKNAPLKKSEDALYIDTTALSIEEVISIILKKVAESP